MIKFPSQHLILLLPTGVIKKPAMFRPRERRPCSLRNTVLYETILELSLWYFPQRSNVQVRPAKISITMLFKPATNSLWCFWWHNLLKNAKQYNLSNKPWVETIYSLSTPPHLFVRVLTSIWPQGFGHRKDYIFSQNYILINCLIKHHSY